LQVDRLELLTDPDNAASQRVAEKVGFRREGVLRSHVSHPDGRRRDSVIFSLLPGELV
jgi:RimJ/RimL family protein N-acetyltransferase